PADPFPPEIQGDKVCGLIWCITDSEEDTESYLQAAREVEKPVFEYVTSMPYSALQTMFDELLPPGLQWYWKGDFIRSLTDEAISVHSKFAEVPTMQSTMHLYPINGAVHEKAPGENSWNHRDVNWSMVIAGIASDPADNKVVTNSARDYWEAMHPHSAGAAYINFMMEEGDERIRATYGDNYKR